MRAKLRYECTSDYERYREDILEFWKRIYGKDHAFFYDSFYAGNPAGEPLLGLCFDGEKLVGQENYIIQEIGSGGRRFRAAMGVNTMVDPDYRLLYGVFGKLCRLTIDSLKPMVDILFAFANEESKKYYLKYFQWNVAAKIRVYKKVTKFSGPNLESILSFVRPGRRHKDLLLEEVSEFDSAVLDPLLEKCLGDSKDSYIYKTTEFLNWKFLSNKHYKVRGYYIKHRGKVAGYCATYDAGFERKVADILIGNNDINIYDQTLSHLSHCAGLEGKRRLVVYATPDCWYEKTLRRNCFIRRWDFDFITRTYDTILPGLQWIIHVGDFDMF